MQINRLQTVSCVDLNYVSGLEAFLHIWKYRKQQSIAVGEYREGRQNSNFAVI